jgi:hypothetical protein
MCLKLTDNPRDNSRDNSPSYNYCGRLVLADAQLFTDFIQCAFFSLSNYIFVGATTTVVTIFTEVVNGGFYWGCF